MSLVKGDRSRRNGKFHYDDDMGDTERTLSTDRSQQDPLNMMESNVTSLVAYHDHTSDKYADDEEDESQCVNEIVQEGKHSRGVGRHRVRCILWTITISVLIAIIVILSVALTQQKKAVAAATAASSSKTSLANTDTVALPPVPEGLEQMCEQGYIEHQTGNSNLFDTCQNSCVVADCCLIPPNIPGTCLTEGTESLCMQYHQACSALVDSNNLEDDAIEQSRAPPTDIPVAPPELESWCSPNSLATPSGSKQCRSTCDAYACCWADIARDSKYALANRQCSLKQNCGSYWPCTYLQAKDTVDVSIGDHVNQVCEASLVTASSPGRNRCRDACKLGLCCFATVPGGGSENKCFGKPPGFCDQYSACSVLKNMRPTEGSINGGIGTSTGGADDDAYGDDDAADDYGDDDFLTDDPLADDDTPTGNDDYYYGDDDDTTGDDDQSTGNQDQDKYPSQPPPLPSDIAVICDKTAVQANDDSLNSCIDYCTEAHCCKVDVSSGAKGSCFADYQALCIQYATYCASVEGYYGDDDGN